MKYAIKGTIILHTVIKDDTAMLDSNGPIPRTIGTSATIIHDDTKLEIPCNGCKKLKPHV
jgi:hypothetical protein